MAFDAFTPWSRGLSVVVPEQTAEALPALNRTVIRRIVARHGQRHVAEALVRAFLVVMRQVFFIKMIQVALAEDDEVAQALSLAGLNPSLDVWTLVTPPLWAGDGFSDEIHADFPIAGV